MLVASQEDCIYINMKDQVEVDIDRNYSVSAIKEIIHDNEDGVFYMLANKFEDKLGFFVFTIQEKDPYYLSSTSSTRNSWISAIVTSMCSET